MPRTRFSRVPKNISDFEKKIGRSTNGEGGRGQPFNGRNSPTDHKTTSDVP